MQGHGRAPKNTLASHHYVNYLDKIFILQHVRRLLRVRVLFVSLAILTSPLTYNIYSFRLFNKSHDDKNTHIQGDLLLLL